MRNGVYEQEDSELRAARAAVMKNPVNGTAKAPQADRPGYPKPLRAEAHHGIVGEFVRLMAPHTEADSNFLVLQFLAYAGNFFGREAFIWAGGDLHYPNLFLCGVGPTNEGRKGSGKRPVQLYFEGIDEAWSRSVLSGLSSGEGLIWAARDPIFKREKVKGNKGAPAEYEDVCEDMGVTDKRILVHEGEFYGALQAMKRQGNTLSTTIREAWDKGDLNTIVKNSPARASGAHISIVANVTREELLRGMVDQVDNGFANRILWCCSKRSKSLPEGGRMWEVEQGSALAELRKRFNQVHGVVKGHVRRDDEAGDIWGRDDNPTVGAYAQLTGVRSGMFGTCTARGAPNTLRLALIYALLDGSQEIRKEHLLAALEVWRYCEDSARYIFGDATGDSAADAIMSALRATTEGLTRWEISNDVFGRNKRADEITRALTALSTLGLAYSEECETGGRAAERWFAGSKPSERMMANDTRRLSSYHS